MGAFKLNHERDISQKTTIVCDASYSENDKRAVWVAVFNCPITGEKITYFNNCSGSIAEIRQVAKISKTSAVYFERDFKLR
jgi:hypothetical protein